MCDVCDGVCVVCSMCEVCEGWGYVWRCDVLMVL